MDRKKDDEAMRVEVFGLGRRVDDGVVLNGKWVW